jgi:tRNA G10  N-methylase Trm11
VSVRLILGDCVETMRQLPDESVDMLLADPPYGHNNHAGDLNSRLNDHREIESKPIANDDPEGFRSVMDAMLTEAARVLKQDCCCCCCCCCCGGRRRHAAAQLGGVHRQRRRRLRQRRLQLRAPVSSARLPVLAELIPRR